MLADHTLCMPKHAQTHGAGGSKPVLPAGLTAERVREKVVPKITVQGAQINTEWRIKEVGAKEV